MRVFPAVAVVAAGSSRLVDRIVVAPAALWPVARALGCESRKVNARVNEGGWASHGRLTFTGRAVRVNGRVDVWVHVTGMVDVGQVRLRVDTVLRHRLECRAAVELLEDSVVERLARAVGGVASDVWLTRSGVRLLPVKRVERRRFVPPSEWGVTGWEINVCCLSHSLIIVLY